MKNVTSGHRTGFETRASATLVTLALKVWQCQQVWWQHWCFLEIARVWILTRAGLWPIASNRAPRWKGPRATPIDLRKLMRDAQLFKCGPIAKENQSELRSILTSSFIIIRSGIVTVVTDFSMCGRTKVFSIAAR